MPMRTRTGNIYNTNAEEDAIYRGRFCNDFPKNWVKDDEQRVPNALFVVDEMPSTVSFSSRMSRSMITKKIVQIIPQILDENEEQMSHSCLWLADALNTLPDFDYHPATPAIEGTESDDVEDSWTSPFLGTIAGILA